MRQQALTFAARLANVPQRLRPGVTVRPNLQQTRCFGPIATGKPAMYINRALLLAVGIVLIFLPALESWAIGTETSWYRPYQLWLLAIVTVWWNQRSRHTDEL